MATFLLSQHKPLRSEVDAVESSAEAELKLARLVSLTQQEPILPASDGPKCAACGSADLRIMFGYTYYLKCSACGGNSKIDEKCPSCGAPERIHKKGLDFTAECTGCGGKRPYFRNPPDAEKAKPKRPTEAKAKVEAS